MPTGMSRDRNAERWSGMRTDMFRLLCIFSYLACIVLPYIVIAYTVMAYTFMAQIVMVSA